MAVDVGISRSGPVDDVDYSQGVSYKDDGYYWFLYPLFERVFKQTGQMVDLYGDAVFEAEHLPHLLVALNEAASLVERQPEEWDVRIGWRGGDPVYCKISKVGLRGLLAGFIALVNSAIRTEKNVVCFGD